MPEHLAYYSLSHLAGKLYNVQPGGPQVYNNGQQVASDIIMKSAWAVKSQAESAEQTLKRYQDFGSTTKIASQEEIDGMYRVAARLVEKSGDASKEAFDLLLHSYAKCGRPDFALAFFEKQAESATTPEMRDQCNVFRAGALIKLGDLYRGNHAPSVALGFYAQGLGDLESPQLRHAPWAADLIRETGVRKKIEETRVSLPRKSRIH